MTRLKSRKVGIRSSAQQQPSSDRFILSVLVPRIEDYSHNNDYRNLEKVVEYLNHHYREYRRHKQGPFRQVVLRAIQAISRKRADKSAAERRLQERESQHIENRASGDDEDGVSLGDDGEEDESGEDNSEGQGEEGTPLRRGRKSEGYDEEESIAIQGLEDADFSVGGGTPGQAVNLLNSSLRMTYDKRPSLRFDSSPGSASHDNLPTPTPAKLSFKDRAKGTPSHLSALNPALNPSPSPLLNPIPSSMGATPGTVTPPLRFSRRIIDPSGSAVQRNLVGQSGGAPFSGNDGHKGGDNTQREEDRGNRRTNGVPTPGHERRHLSGRLGVGVASGGHQERFSVSQSQGKEGLSQKPELPGQCESEHDSETNPAFAPPHVIAAAAAAAKALGKRKAADVGEGREGPREAAAKLGNAVPGVSEGGERRGALGEDGATGRQGAGAVLAGEGREEVRAGGLSGGERQGTVGGPGAPAQGRVGESARGEGARVELPRHKEGGSGEVWKGFPSWREGDTEKRMEYFGSEGRMLVPGQQQREGVVPTLAESGNPTAKGKSSSSQPREGNEGPSQIGPAAGKRLRNREERVARSREDDGPMGEEGASGRGEKASHPRSKRARRNEEAPRREKAHGDAEAPGGASSLTSPRQVRFGDFGGIEGTLHAIRELIEYPLAHPELYQWLGVEPPRGVLLHGPPGCGKTMLAHAIAVETGVPFLKISAPEVVSGMSGESEAKIRSLFADAVRLAPCIVFIDEIDAITPKRETAQREMERRIVAQLLTCMDDLNQPIRAFAEIGERSQAEPGCGHDGPMRGGHVVVLGATNRPDSLDPALRRAGRFDREIALGIPDEDARARILEVLSRRLRLEGSFNFKQIARRTPGFVGADLQALTKEAAAIAVKRIFAKFGPPASKAPPTDLKKPSGRAAVNRDTENPTSGDALGLNPRPDHPRANANPPTSIDLLRRGPGSNPIATLISGDGTGSLAVADFRTSVGATAGLSETRHGALLGGEPALDPSSASGGGGSGVGARVGEAAELPGPSLSGEALRSDEAKGREGAGRSIGLDAPSSGAETGGECGAGPIADGGVAEARMDGGGGGTSGKEVEAWGRGAVDAEARGREGGHGERGVGGRPTGLVQGSHGRGGAIEETAEGAPGDGEGAGRRTRGGGGSEEGRDDDLWKRAWTAEEMQSLRITMDDFEGAIGKVQPSAKREGFATIPDVTWEDVGALGEVREELEFSISRPIKHPEDYQAMGLDMAVGVLLYGPPGCGKTLVAKAIAADAGANFISIKGPELLNKFVGESERAVRQLFSRARASAPCVLFFDEMDAMAPRRGSDGNQAAERVVNQLLTEMDGLDSRKSIFLIAATNRPDMIDSALLRPGRLDKLLYVPLPTPEGRASIMRTLARRAPLGPGLDAPALAQSDSCAGFSGADLAALVREACIAALRERRSGGPAGGPHAGPPLVEARHFDSALERVLPSVSAKDVMRYESMRQKLRRARSHIGKARTDKDGLEHPTDVDINGGQ